MTPESLSIPIATASGCCSETPPASNILPIAAEQGSKDACCESPATNSESSSVAPATIPHGESCSHHAMAAEVVSVPAETGSTDDSAGIDDSSLIDALREVIDPELMINIVDLGLVYSINHTDKKVLVEMTLTSPACPAGPQIISQAKMSLEKVPGVDAAEIKLTMSPPWTPDRMTDDARDQLGIF